MTSPTIPPISAVTKIELLRFNTSPEATKILNDFVGECAVFDLNDAVVEKTISVCKSSRIKIPDAIIAATALVNNAVLITRNFSDFKSIKGLALLNPWDIPEDNN